MSEITKNVFRCSICQGPVDKHRLCFVCRNCGAMGDFTTGIMTDMNQKIISKRLCLRSTLMERE